MDSLLKYLQYSRFLSHLYDLWIFTWPNGYPFFFYSLSYLHVVSLPFFSERTIESQLAKFQYRDLTRSLLKQRSYLHNFLFRYIHWFSRENQSINKNHTLTSHEGRRHGLWNIEIETASISFEEGNSLLRCFNSKPIVSSNWTFSLSNVAELTTRVAFWVCPIPTLSEDQKYSCRCRSF